MKTVFLFAGQGSQAPGMAVELVHESAEAAKVFDCASSVLGFDLLDRCAGGTPEELAVTTVAQPAIMATSLAALACVRERGIEAEAVAGHSLGEYSARYEGSSEIFGALCEALVNGLVNADYYGDGGISVELGEGKAVFSNAGSFRINPENAASGGVSDPRSAPLSRIFSYAGGGRRSGSGIPGIFAVWKKLIPTRLNILRLHFRWPTIWRVFVMCPAFLNVVVSAAILERAGRVRLMTMMSTEQLPAMGRHSLSLSK